jgi:hypothetical protein
MVGPESNVGVVGVAPESSPPWVRLPPPPPASLSLVAGGVVEASASLAALVVLLGLLELLHATSTKATDGVRSLSQQR